MATLAALETATPHALLRLPYPEDALAPVISARTVALHHGKHHKAYVDKTNELIGGTEFEGQALERIVLATAGKPEHKELFNNAAQAWNHAFYWRSLKPRGGGAPALGRSSCSCPFCRASTERTSPRRPAGTPRSSRRTWGARSRSGRCRRRAHCPC